MIIQMPRDLSKSSEIQQKLINYDNSDPSRPVRMLQNTIKKQINYNNSDPLRPVRMLRNIMKIYEF